MNQPDVGDLHVNRLLTNFSIGFLNNPDGYVADRVFPLVPSDKQSDVYARYNRGDFFQGAETGQGDGGLLRAPGTEAKKVGYRVNNSSTFYAINYAIGVDIPDELRSNADAVFELDSDATNLCTEVLRIRREIEFNATAMAANVWGDASGSGDDAGTTDFVKFSDYAGSDPFGVLEDRLDGVEGATGKRPNKIVMGAICWRRLKHHPDFLDRIKGGATTGNPAMMSKAQLAAMLEVDEVLVARSSYRTSVEKTGNDTPTLARIVDDDILMAWVPDSPSRFQPMAGSTFYWRPLTGGNVQFIRRYRSDKSKKDVVEAHGYWDMVVTEPYSGFLLLDAVD